MKVHSNITVAIWMITYNHESYIERAVNSVMNQVADFEFVLFLSEDCSRDNTRLLCTQLKEKYGDKIELFLPPKNLGIKSENGIGVKTYDSCLNSGAKYMAFLEGDDYWTDDKKLQKQVDFLEKNSNYSMCFHEVDIHLQDTNELVNDYITRKVSFTVGLTELAKGNFIHTPSALIRSSVLPLPNWFYRVPTGDYAIWCLSALKGKIYKMPDKMAVYRVHDKGAMSGFKSANLSEQIVHNEGMIPFYRDIYIRSKEVGFKNNEVHLLDVNRSNFVKLGEFTKARTATFLMLKNELKFMTFKQISACILTILTPFYLKWRYAKK